MPTDKELMDEPFDFQGFDQVRAVYGDEAAWDALFSLGFGSDDWEDVQTTVTTRVLEETAKAHASENGTGASRVDTRVPTDASGSPNVGAGELRDRLASKDSATGVDTQDKPAGISAEDRVARSRLIRSAQQG